MGLGLLGLLVIFLNVQSLLAGQGTELTTSVALLVTGFTGVFCGLGHTLTPVAVSVVSAALLAWKEPMAGFSIGLTEAELRFGDPPGDTGIRHLPGLAGGGLWTPGGSSICGPPG